MIRQIAPVFFTMDIPRTVAFYTEKLGFELHGLWPGGEAPPVYGMVARDGRAIHFRCAEPPGPQADKYDEELLDAYIFVQDADALYAEFQEKGVEFARGLGNMAWKCREFVVKDCDGRLLAFGSDI
jgi:catechol 2,3-dioxygenase-like lactoylglutathione lyase family enzyme